MSFGAPSEHVTDERLVLATGFAQTVLNNPGDVHPGVWAELRQHFSEVELMELTFIVGHYIGTQIFTFLLEPDIETD